MNFEVNICDIDTVNTICQRFCIQIARRVHVWDIFGERFSLFWAASFDRLENHGICFCRWHFLLFCHQFNIGPNWKKKWHVHKLDRRSGPIVLNYYGSVALLWHNEKVLALSESAKKQVWLKMLKIA